MEKKVKDMTKAEVLDRIISDKSRAVKVIPLGLYSDKMQTVRTNKVEA